MRQSIPGVADRESVPADVGLKKAAAALMAEILALSCCSGVGAFFVRSDGTSASSS